MCGRFILTSTAEVVAELFEVAEVPTLKPRENICPTQTVAAVVQADESGARAFRWFRWGLVPSWAKDMKIGARMFNARGDTVAEKPSFKSAFRRRRCLIIADGFYEWKKTGTKKQPFLIRTTDTELMGLAGLWERWTSVEGEQVDSCTIITTEPNELMSAIHDRMPVILSRSDYDAWLDLTCREPAAIQRLIRAYPAEAMMAQPITSERFSRREGGSLIQESHTGDS